MNPLFFYSYTFVLFLGIVLIKAYWIISDPRPSNEKLNDQMLTSNIKEFFIILLQTVAGLLLPFSAEWWEIVLMVLGTIMFVTGAFLAIWARLVMKHSWFVPGRLTSDKKHTLVTSGPFAFSRNPIYLGFFIDLFWIYSRHYLEDFSS